ncbi:hypothetical protein B0T11DRAFT_103494 [Plectosphaerella cucumerina]|uniref:Uncharacterized protein n=1 Tax=Plectosphaerella cucumerina TaxID=40658 RepID=A0A8K0TD63_9PEZI|nr:hypothetical protein B0T11DRAFT_103494 [Plectosphaerella cucumerina]
MSGGGLFAISQALPVAGNIRRVLPDKVSHTVRRPTPLSRPSISFTLSKEHTSKDHPHSAASAECGVLACSRFNRLSTELVRVVEVSCPCYPAPALACSGLPKPSPRPDPIFWSRCSPASCSLQRECLARRKLQCLLDDTRMLAKSPHLDERISEGRRAPAWHAWGGYWAVGLLPVEDDRPQRHRLRSTGRVLAGPAREQSLC